MVNDDAKVKKIEYVKIGDAPGTEAWKYAQETPKAYIFECGADSFFIPKKQATIDADGVVSLPVSTLAWVKVHGKPSARGGQGQ